MTRHPEQYRLDEHLKASRLACRILIITRAQQNCSLIWCRDTLQAAVVDPGGDIESIIEAVEQEGVNVERILITHGHGDHAGAATRLADTLEVPIDGPHVGEEPVIQKIKEIEKYLPFNCEPYTPRQWFEHQDQILIGCQSLMALHCPGHTPGSIVYFCETSRLAFTGDVLFKYAIGAVKTPFDHLELLRSVRQKLLPLGDDILFIPGHQELSTFGAERLHSPVVSDEAAEQYTHLFDDSRFSLP